VWRSRSISSLLCMGLALGCLAMSAVAPAGARTASGCGSLRLTRAVRGQLDAAYRRATHLPASVRLSSVGRAHYGRCGSTYYAYDRLQPAPGQRLTGQEKVGQQDQSYVDRRGRRGRWVELGLGPRCGPGYIPPALARIWRLRC